MSQALPPGFGDWTGDRKYELRGTLGAGAMGVVLDGFDRQIERRVAIKVVRKPAPDDAEAVEAAARFKREAQAAGRLSHPGIVGVYDYGENDDTAWIVMEMVQGGTLKAMMDRNERLPLRETVRIMGQVLSALAYAHARGIVHRDIKPANVMLTEEGDAKLADFGIARIENSAMTQVGTLMGTPSYMAPEQLRGEPLDARADIWAAGVMLYQLLTGEKPFPGGFSAVMHKVLNTEPVPPSALASSLPAAMDAAVLRALAKRPEDRWPDARAFAAAIEAAASAPSLPAARPADGAEEATLVMTRATAAPRPAPPPASHPAPGPGTPARRPGWVLPAAGFGVLALLGAGAALMVPRGETPSPPVAGGAGPATTAPGAAAPPSAASAPAPPAPALPSPALPSTAVTPPALPVPAGAAEPRAARPETAATATPPVVSPTLPTPPAPMAAAPRPASPEVPPPGPASPDAPAAGTTAPPAPVPGPQASLVPTPRPDWRALSAAAIAAAPCGLVSAQVEEAGFRLRGVMPRAEADAVRQDIARRNLPAGAAQLDLRTFEGPFCPLLATLRPVLAAPGEAPEVILEGTAPLRKGQLLRFGVRLPAWATHLHVVYATADGSVARLEADATTAPGARIRLGDPRPGFQGWEIDEPYGTDLLLVVASEEPLFAPGAPAVEAQAAYARGFAASVQLARAAGRRIALVPLVVETAP